MYQSNPDIRLTGILICLLVSVTVADWKTDADERIERIRKTDFQISLVDPRDSNRDLSGIQVEIEQIRQHFAFGSAINYNIENPRYAAFFKNNFEWAVMENESKWYANQPRENQVTYAMADRIVDFCAANNITMRGHCLFWAKEKYVQNWLKGLDTEAFRTAVENRLADAVNHFKGTFVHWDVNNEMCDGAYYVDRLGPSIRPWMFKAAGSLAPDCVLFVNDYDVISNGRNMDEYKQQIAGLRRAGAPVGGIGAQCHMSTGFDPAVIKQRFDSLAESGLPIWVTEFDVSQPDEDIRADELENFYRVAFSHPAVKGILMWGFWESSHWRPDCYIVNTDWTPNAAGRRYQELMDEWRTQDTGDTNADGMVQFRGFYGTYQVTVTAEGDKPAITTIDVTPDGLHQFTVTAAPADRG